MEATKNVLICEDDPVQLKILSTMITQAGYRSIAARSPVEAVVAARRCGIDAVVADVQLQDGNAFDLVSDLRQMGFDAPMFMASAHATEGIKRRARAAGIRDFFEKPFNFSAIRSGVAAALETPVRLEATVLLLENHPETRASLQKCMEAAGFDVVVSQDGSQALDLLRSRGRSIDLLVTDLHGKGPSGGVLIRQALEIVPGLQVVAISGDARRERIREAYEAGAAFFLRKPISDAMIGNLLKARLKASRDARTREDERRERLAAESFPRKCKRWVQSYLQAPSRSRKAALRGGLALGGLALAIGALVGMLAQQASEAVAAQEALLRNAMETMSRGPHSRGERTQAGWGAPEINEQLRLMRDANDITSRYYQDSLKEMRLQSQVHVTPAAAIPLGPAGLGRGELQLQLPRLGGSVGR